MTYGYIRTSTGGQDGQGQRNAITEYCAREGVKVDQWIMEQTSSHKKRSEREVSRLVETIRTDDVILVSELSRLARSSTLELSAIIQDIREAGGTLVVVGDNLTFAPDAIDLQAELMLNALGVAARIERDLISSRTTSALAARKAQGVKLGRPAGSSKLRERESDLQKYLGLGLNKTAIAKLLGVSRSTLYDYLRTRKVKA